TLNNSAEHKFAASQATPGYSFSMETRQLGGLTVPMLSFGCGTFGGTTPTFKAWGDSDAEEATRLVDICLDAGICMFDSADIYSAGMSETILGQAVKG